MGSEMCIRDRVWGVSRKCCSAFGAPWGDLETFCSVLERSWRVSGRSWGDLGVSGSRLDASWSGLGFVWGSSWVRLGVVFGRLGAVLDRLGVIFGWSWGVLERLGGSWVPTCGCRATLKNH